MHLGATELFHLVTLTGSGYIYRRAKFWKFLQTPSPACNLLCLLWSPDRPLVASDLPPLVSAAVNGNLHRRCRRSKFVAELVYELELCAILNSDS